MRRSKLSVAILYAIPPLLVVGFVTTFTSYARQLGWMFPVGVGLIWLWWKLDAKGWI